LLIKDRPKGTAARRPEIRGYFTRTFLKVDHKRHGIPCSLP
jgi:hypothetical protein